MEKLVGEKLRDIRARIESQRQKVTEAVDNLKRLSMTEEKKKEYKAKQQDAEFKLKFYKEHGVEEKLQKQVDFDADSRKCSQTVSFTKGYLSDLEAFINRYEDDLKNQRVYKSRQNESFFEGFLALYEELIVAFAKIKEANVAGKMTLSRLQAKTKEFESSREGLKEAPVMLQHRGHARLLQHDFGDPDTIGIARRTPGKVAVMRRIPGPQRGPHLDRRDFQYRREYLIPHYSQLIRIFHTATMIMTSNR